MIREAAECLEHDHYHTGSLSGYLHSSQLLASNNPVVTAYTGTNKHKHRRRQRNVWYSFPEGITSKAVSTHDEIHVIDMETSWSRLEE